MLARLAAAIVVLSVTGCAARPKVAPTPAPAAAPQPEVAEVAASEEPTPAPARLTREEAEADARHLFGLLETSHPDPYRGMGGKVEFKRRAQALLRALPAEGIATVELGDRLAAFLAPLGDGHTFVRTTGQRWRDPEPFLPIAFAVTSDGLYVTGHDIPVLRGMRGHRIAAAAGVEIDELARRLGEQLAVENRVGAYLRLRNTLRSRKLLANLEPSIADAESLPLQLVSPRGRRTTVKVPLHGSSKPPAEWAEPERSWPAHTRADTPYEGRFFADGRVGYLRIADMMGREAFESMLRFGWGDAREALTRYHAQRNLDMPDDLEEALTHVPSLLEVGRDLLERMKAEHTGALIVDLRGNTGGVTTTFIVLAAMLHGDAAFGVPFGERFVQVPSPLLLDKYHQTFEAYAKEHDRQLRPGDYAFGEPALDPSQARKEAVKAWKEAGLSYAAPIGALDGAAIYTPPHVMALCDATTFSAGFHAMYFLDQLGATVVGVPPQQSPNAFMEITPFVLPISRIEGAISNSAQLLLPDDPDATIYPLDHEVDAAVLARYHFDRETPLRWALDLLRRRAAGQQP